MLFSIAGIIIVVSVFGMVKRNSLPKSERTEIGFNLSIVKKERGFLANFLSLLLVAVITGTIGIFGYVMANSQSGEYFAEFYALCIDGTASNYPSTFYKNGEGSISKVEYDNVMVREGFYGELTLGITSHEEGSNLYSVCILANESPLTFIYKYNGQATDEIKDITLKNGGNWQGKILFTPPSYSTEQKIKFVLSMNGEVKYDSPPYIWINVIAE